MIKKISLLSLFFIYCSTPVWAINVLQENATLRRELNNLSSQQQNENLKNIKYYSGLSSYSGIEKSHYSSNKYSNSQKNIYTKKGVKFKIDKERQEQLLKELQEQEKTLAQPEEIITEKKTEEKIKPEKQPQKKSNHNHDAE